MSDNPFTSGGKLATPPSRAQQAPPPPPPAPAQPPAVQDAITGNVIGKFNDGPLCTRHFPNRAELARLAWQARTGNPAPFVGTGHEYTALSCACLGPGDHPWKLGDHAATLAHSCLANQHDSCLDMSCECDCGSHEARARAAAVYDNKLAAALKEISAAMSGGSSTELLELVRELQATNAALSARVAALEPAEQDDPEPDPDKPAAKTTARKA